MTPKTPIEEVFRAETLRLAQDQPFAQKLLNSGRLSVPCSLEDMDLQTPGTAQVAPGRAMLDAPLTSETGNSWLLNEVQGHFTLVGFGDVLLPDLLSVRRIGINQRADYPCFTAASGHAIRRYGSAKAYLFRPDGHVCAVFDNPTEQAVLAARARALGAELEEAAA